MGFSTLPFAHCELERAQAWQASRSPKTASPGGIKVIQDVYSKFGEVGHADENANFTHNVGLIDTELCS